MAITVSQIRGELADREAIKDCLYRFSRGIDRCDEEMLRSAFWEDAIDEHMTFKGTREELIAWTLPIVRTMDQVMHLLGNMLIRIDGAKADVESYFYAFHRIPGPDRKPRDTIGSGRYLDKLERRGDEWRITRRIVITDWFRDYPDSGDWEVGPLGMKVPPGGRHPDDLSYSFLTLR